MQGKIRHLVALASVTTAGLALACPAQAVERGAGFYLLGSKGPAAGITPPPGVYFQNDFWFYDGKLGGGREFPSGGRVAIGVEGKAALSAPTLLWVLPEELMGGRVGIGVTIPYGWMGTDADLTLTGPGGGVLATDATDPIFTIGDPIVSGQIGWDAGNFHWNTGLMVNVPIGDYQDGELSNIAFHHWGADVNAAATWLDPSTGLDLSAAMGVTFNAENPATDYRSGTEFHFEWAAVQHFSKKFDAGLVGYAYQQLTPDGGEGSNGPFKGRAFAIGATVGWNFEVAEHPVSARIKYFHEFGTENRAEGDSVFLTIAVPLSVPRAVAAQ